LRPEKASSLADAAIAPLGNVSSQCFGIGSECLVLPIISSFSFHFFSGEISMLSLTFGVRLRYFIALLFLVDIALFSRLHILREAMSFLAHFSCKILLNKFIRKSVIFLALLLALALPRTAHAQVVTTLAGSTAGFADATGTAAQFNFSYGVCSDGAGNLFVADTFNNCIRKIVIATGVVTTFAGQVTAGLVDAAGTGAQFHYPTGICSDGAGNLFVADQTNHCIRRIVIATGIVTTLAGQATAGFTDATGTAAQFFFPTGICSDGAGNLFVADLVNHRIRKIVIATGVVTTLAGSTLGSTDATGASAQFYAPQGICSDGMGNLFVAEQGNKRIRKIVIATGVVTTLAGSTAGFTDATGTAARFGEPYGVCSDGAGNLFVADYGNSRIRKIVIATGVVTTLAGQATTGFTDATGTAARFNGPAGICTDGVGNLFVADQFNSRIRKISPIVPQFQGIISFTPTFGSAGTSVVITGSGFTGATAVSFGGTPASSFVVNSDTQITAVVGSSTAVTGGQQAVVVTAPSGTFSLGGFSLGAAAQSGGTVPTGSTAPQLAVLSGFSPQSIGFGTPITLSGSGFTGATGLLIGGVPVTNFVVVNDNTITAVVGGVPVNDRVQLTGGLGASLDMSGLGLTYLRLPAPVIASVSSASLSASGDDAALTLSGFNFLTSARVLVREQNADAATAITVPTSNLTATQAAMTLPGVLRSPGTKIITLVNPDGQSGSIALTVVTGAAVQLSANDGQPFVFTTTASGRAFSVRLSGTNIFRTAQAFIGTLQARVSVPSSTEAIVEVPASVNEFGGVSLTLRLQNSDGQSTTASVRIERRPPPTILAVTLQSDGRLRVRGVNFMNGIRAALANSALAILSQDGDTVLTAHIPNTFRLMANTPTVSLTVENPDGRSHGVLLPRSFFDGQIGSASAGNVVTPERTWENSNVTTELVEIVAGKQVQNAFQELSIYPNPMETELRIGGVGQRTVRLYDMRGGLVLEEHTTSGVVNVVGLSAGAYTVVVESADGQTARVRVVKK
jgi:hypothetical protein